MNREKEIGYILHRAAMSAKCHFTNKLSKFDITPGQLAVLKEIYYYQINNNELGLSPACIAARLEFDRPTMTGILERMEAQGWAERVLNPQDKRSCLIRVTKKATDKLKELEDIATENSFRILKGFTEEEVVNFKNYLLRVTENCKE
ncbi:MarR family winged helix-turn-helix transcriptional regulator [Anaerocolumna sp. MB42-C2]|uniref:MarR family winged helix-turn-helix transcriptional regulator n=1 Tax=Anaerocolumna sp. MB42-C2 TaxID=3070997 RepID=UPI0027DEC237|nr:MarR family transcriptional regulator [Anaerocolumna sp. MB42-C2]WMJ89735.1 MarR family transcriptional regulator [Anaerocolumna sp. MB42-C2]